ncbi:MAG: TonB-dependent receptor [Terriglobia bacterium]|jgi:hypothetical protein
MWKAQLQSRLRKGVSGCIVPLVALLLLPAAASAQFSLRSSINGVISDATGAIVPGVTVTLNDVDRNQTKSVKTDQVGAYAFTDLIVGHYRVSAEISGFKTAVSNVVELSPGQTVRVDLTLQPGEVKQTVEVTDTVSTLQTETMETGGIADHNYIENLPTEGRNYTSFAQLATNVSIFPRGNGGATFSVGAEQTVGGVQYQAGGGGANGFYINGVNNNDNYVGYISYAPSQDAIGEVKLDVANFSAASGRDVTTLNATTRSGTSHYHGAVYDYLENDGLNAIDPYTKATVPDAGRNFLQRHQWGGNFGGPIYIPKLYHPKDRAFFFANYERLRERDGTQANFYRIPTAAERQGDFSQLLQDFPGNANYILYNPYSTVVNPDGSTLRTPILNNDLRNITKPDGSPAIDPTALDYVTSIYPQPNYVDPFGPEHSLNNYQSLNPFGANSYRFDSRYDFRISDKDNIYFTFNRSQGTDFSGGTPFPELPPSYPPNVSDGAILITANYARIFSPTLANEFIFSWGRGNFLFPKDSVQAFLHRTDTPFNKPFQNLGSGVDYGSHAIEIGDGYYFPGYGENFRDKNPSLQFSDNLTWVRGHHTLQAGFAYFRKNEQDYDLIRNADFFGTFTRAGSANVDPNGDSIGHVGGNSLADLELGLVTDIRQRFVFQGGNATDPAINTQSTYYGAFLQDKWQVLPKLTLNLGLRYDLNIPLFDANRFFGGTVDFTYPGLQLVTPGRTSGVPLHFVTADKNNLAPRFSLAYRPRSDIVLRAGYGVFYEAGAGGIIRTMNFYAASSPGSFNGDEYNNALAGLNADAPYLTFSDIYPAPRTVQVGNFPISTGPGSGYFQQGSGGTGGTPVSVVDKKSGTVPYFQTFLFSVEKSLTANTVLSVSYLGTLGRQQPYFENVNLPPYCLGCYTDPSITDPARPYGGERLTDINVARHGLNSSYHAGTIKVERKFSRGLQFLTHYTFSKTTQDVYDPCQFAAQGNFGAYCSAVWQYHRQRGEANFSHPHRLLSAVVWQIPFGASLPKPAKAALWGWKVSSITTFESGNADTILNTIDSAFDLEPEVPLLVGKANLSSGQRNFLNYFNTAAFVDPGAGNKGNAGPGIVREPGRNNWDISLMKNFKPNERISFLVRADFLNAFNHTQWHGINTYDGGPGSGFGSVTGSYEPRIMQIGLKLLF